MEYQHKPVRTLAKGDSIRGTYRILSDGRITYGDSQIGTWEKIAPSNYKATIDVIIDHHGYRGMGLCTHHTTTSSYCYKELLYNVGDIMERISTYGMYKV